MGVVSKYVGYHGQPYSHKPPLLYWLVMGSYSIFGVHDWAARLVPCAAGFLTVIVTYLWGCRAVGTLAALIGAILLCLSARFVYLGRMFQAADAQNRARRMFQKALQLDPDCHPALQELRLLNMRKQKGKGPLGWLRRK